MTVNGRQCVKFLWMTLAWTLSTTMMNRNSITIVLMQISISVTVRNLVPVSS